MSKLIPRRFSAYHFEFNETGNKEIDKILSAICFAGKGYHHTENWQDDLSDYGDYSGGSYIGWIQNSANEAAAELKKLRDERDKLVECVKKAFPALDSVCDYFLHLEEHAQMVGVSLSRESAERVKLFFEAHQTLKDIGEV